MALDVVGRPLTPKSNTITDVNYAYSVSSNKAISVDAEVVTGAIFNVMTTLIGDEMHDPLYGSNLPLYVFDTFTEGKEQIILLDIFEALKRNVPQVSLSFADTNMFVSNDGRIVGISIAVTMSDQLFTVDINFGIP